METRKGETKEYKILEFIGGGRTGDVYKAQRISLAGKTKDPVAIKILKNKNQIQELITEFEILRKIDSKRVVKVFSVERLSGDWALIMEYIDGLSLSYLLRQNLNPNTENFLYHELTIALNDLEESQVFHGDLAPQNILITKKGKLKLLDFASHYNDNFNKYGTLNFLPPEQKNGQHLGIKTDQSALELIFPNVDKGKKVDSITAIKEIASLFVEEERFNDQTRTIMQHKASAACAVFAIGVSIAILLFPQNSPVFAAAKKRNKEIYISSRVWMHLKVNGKEQGYTPVHFKTNKEILVINWRSRDDRGSIKLEIKKNTRRINLQMEKLLTKKQ